MCIGAGRNAGRMIRAMAIPMKTAFSTAPIAIDTGKPAVLPHFLRSSPTQSTRMIFPIMIHGNIAGIAAITGLPVMKNDVTGVIMLRIMPHAIPA